MYFGGVGKRGGRKLFFGDARLMTLDHRHFDAWRLFTGSFIFICVYIYLKKKDCSVWVSRKGNVLVVTQYSVYAYMPLGMFWYMQWRWREKQRKTSSLLVWQFTSPWSWVSMEILAAKALCNAQSSSAPEMKKQKDKVISKLAFAALHRNVKGRFNATLSMVKGLE